MFREHRRYDALTFFAASISGVQCVLYGEANPATVPGNTQQAISHSNRRRTNVSAFDLEVGTFFRREQTQNSMTGCQFSDSRIGRETPNKFVAKQGDVADHRRPERINQNCGPHVRDHVTLILVHGRHDLGHALRSIFSSTFVKIVRLGDADAVFSISACCRIEDGAAVGCFGPARKWIQQPRASDRC